MVIDPVASLERGVLVFRSQQRAEREVAPKLGRMLPTGGLMFSDAVRQRLAMTAGMTLARVLPAGGTPPRIEVPNDRCLRVCVRHGEPEEAARACAAALWRMGQACRVESGAMGQLVVVAERLPLRVRFMPNRAALLRHLGQRFEGQARQAQVLAGLGSASEGLVG